MGEREEEEEEYVEGGKDGRLCRGENKSDDRRRADPDFGESL